MPGSIDRVSGVTSERWQDAQKAERGFWSTEGFGLKKFRRAVGGSIDTAEWVRRHTTVPPGDWLEVGIGPLGVGCAHFLEGGEELHTLDPIDPISADEWQLPEPCKALVRSCQERVTRHVGQAEHLDFAENAFTLVAMENMLDHVQDPGAVLSEARRVLAPGGCMVLAVDTFSMLGEVRFKLVSRRKWQDTTFVRAHPHRFSGNDVLAMVAAAGFTVTTAETPSFAEAAVGRHFRTRLLAT
jgi:SAM-dependent methyltransferase